MINDLSLVLRNILSDPALPEPLRSAQIELDHPTETYTPAGGLRTINVFLYDIRENAELRNNEPVVERLNGQARITRAPLRVECSYLITAWPDGTGQAMFLQEHQLLSQVLQAFSRFSTIPPNFLTGTALVGQEPPLPLMTAQAGELKSPSEFWTAMGSRLRPSLTVSATISIQPFTADIFPIAATKQFGIEPIDNPAAREDLFEFGGRVTDAGNNPVDAATVTVTELGLVTTTDVDGRYRIGLVAASDYTVRVEKLPATTQVTITVPAPLGGSDYNVQFP
jgi:Pvc16 N-terminal domain/Carboxypeptidase regulatory-like domain